MNVFSQIFTIQNWPKFCLKSFYKKCELIYVKLLSSVLKTGSFYGAFAHIQIHTLICGSRLVEKKNLRVVVNFKEDGMLVFKSWWMYFLSFSPYKIDQNFAWSLFTKNVNGFTSSYFHLSLKSGLSMVLLHTFKFIL